MGEAASPAPAAEGGACDIGEDMADELSVNDPVSIDLDLVRMVATLLISCDAAGDWCWVVTER